MSGPVFHLEALGRLGNLMIEYMVALKFVNMVRGCRISNISLPAWGIHHQQIDSPGPVAFEGREQHIDLVALADKMWAQDIRRVEWKGFGQRMENLLPRERYRDVFVSPFGKPMGYGPEFLVCPVRAEDVLERSHPDYVLTPVEFYRDMVEMTGLRPVFIGQTHPNSYVDRIKAAFPEAIFREPQDDPLVDFETIRQSRNAVVGVSTFSWVAAWLSDSLENIFLTVNGLFNPAQKSDVDLLPAGDPRYRFFLFPINFQVPLDRHADMHRRIAPYWREMPLETLRQQWASVPRLRLEDALAVFDKDHYIEANPDVAALAAKMWPGFTRKHFEDHGFKEGRIPVHVDRRWYAGEYPLAAFEVAMGEYTDFLHHFVAVGHARGYRPSPVPGEC